MAKKEEKKEIKKNNKKESKNKKSFFKGLKAELKKVIWPTPKQLVNSTTAVLVIVLITAVIVFALDFVFNLLNIEVLDRIKESLISNTSIESTEQNLTIDNENQEIVVEDTNIVQDNTTVVTENTVTENVTE